MKKQPPPMIWRRPPRRRLRLNVKTGGMVLGICAALVLLPGWTQQAPEAYEPATTQALDRLIRTTRRGGGAARRSFFRRARPTRARWRRSTPIWSRPSC